MTEQEKFERTLRPAPAYTPTMLRTAAEQAEQEDRIVRALLGNIERAS